MLTFAALQAKCLRVLQYFPPPDDPALTDSLNETLRRIITGKASGRLSAVLHVTRRKSTRQQHNLPATTWLAVCTPSLSHLQDC